MVFKRGAMGGIVIGIIVIIIVIVIILSQFDITGNAIKFFKKKAPTITPTFSSEDGTGLNASYYDNKDFTNLKINRIDPNVDYTYGGGSPDPLITDDDTFSIRWEGYIIPLYTETYTFYTYSNDGMRIYVNNQLIVSDWTNHVAQEKSGTIALQAGRTYPIKIEYYQDGGTALVQANWSSSSQVKEVIPQSALRHTQIDQPPSDTPYTLSCYYNSSGSQFCIDMLWNKTNGLSGNDISFDVEFDSNGNIIVGSVSYTNTQSVISKYDSNGLMIWNKTLLGQGIYDVAIDSSNNIYGIGRISKYVVKYDTNGNLLFNGITDSSISEGGGAGIAIDSLNNFIITSHNSINDLVVEKRDSNGVKLWNRIYSGAGADHGYAVDTDNSNNVYVTGHTRATLGGNSDIILLKYDSNGNLQWNKKFGGAKDDSAYSVKVNNNNIYLTGRTQSFTNSIASGLLLKYDNNGNLLFNRIFTNGDDSRGNSVVVKDNIYLTGIGYTSGNDDLLFYIYDLNGNLIQNHILGGYRYETGEGINTFTDGSIVIVGHSDSSISAYDNWIIKLNHYLNSSPVTPPAIPTGFNANAVSSSSIQLTWNSVSGATSYKVERSLLQSGTFTQIGTSTTNSFIDTGLSALTTYYYRIKASNSAGDSDYTNVMSATTFDIQGNCEISGDLKKWQTTILTCKGPLGLTETGASPNNPFLDYRFNVLFTSPTGNTLNVPGYYDGNDATGSSVWVAKLNADEQGTWIFTTSFRKGVNIAVDLNAHAGTPIEFDGTSDSFPIADRDPNAPGFLKYGELEYVGGHYFKFRDGPYWIKGGADSPENFMGFIEFDNTPQTNFCKPTSGKVMTYSNHVQDWQTGDPTWNNGKGKGIIGALNYLSSKGVNSIYFLPMNIGGDACDTHPYAQENVDWNGGKDSGNDNLHMDVSKLQQWDIVFSHAQKKGIFLHFVLAEAEENNKIELDNTAQADTVIGPERKLFYRELVARFAHHNALQWNMAEEYDYVYELKPELIKSWAQYMQDVDPYDHPITVHQEGSLHTAWDPFVGDPKFSVTSFQISGTTASNGAIVEEWRTFTRNAGRPIVISLDELRSITSSNMDSQRKLILWPTFLSGGQTEWYVTGAADHSLDDFRTYENLYRWTGYAIQFMNTIPFNDMNPNDSLLTGETGSGQVFARTGEVYAIYLPSGGSGNLNLASGTYRQRWYNPRTGLYEGVERTITGGSSVSLGTAPSSTSEDWVVLIEKI